MTPLQPHPAQTHLDTDSVERNIRAHTALAGLVTIAAQGAKFAITTATIGVLGRLLTPRDFGLVTMVMVVIVGCLKSSRQGIQLLPVGIHALMNGIDSGKTDMNGLVHRRSSWFQNTRYGKRMIPVLHEADIAGSM